MTMKTFKRRYVPLLVAACFGVADAAPTLPQVVAGQATFNQQGNVFSITNTPGTIINWQSFSVNPGEITRFIQQSSDSAVLNRILGQDPSRILGALQSNGKVFLINPNGVLFGRDARVDVNGLVASTLNISNADFLAGKKNFTAGPAAGEVRNEGMITTPNGGQVFLIAPNVTNAGVISSPNGDVVLAAGHSVQLVDSRDPNLMVVVSAPDNQAINLGQVVAQGGRIGIYGALVNQRGVVNANSAVVGENGKIVLKASRDTVLEQGSVTTATGAGVGGEIQLLGERVGLDGNASVDASGAAGGGTVLVGGDWQGKNAQVQNARQTWFGKDASIKADALVNGDGGKVVLWSNGDTGTYGSISARGGALGGSGGMVETSGHNLDITGVTVDIGAGKGKGGSWLLDPYDIEVVASGATASVNDVKLFSAGPSTGVTKIAPSTLVAGGNIVLQAEHDLTITDAITTAFNVKAEAKNDINVNAKVSSTGGSLDFRAGNKFTLSSSSSLASPNRVFLKADRMALNGDIFGVGGVLPYVTLTSATDSRAISLNSTYLDNVLSIDVGALSRINAFAINIGDSGHTAPISIDAPVTKTVNMVIDNSGHIEINKAVNLGSGTNFIASLWGPSSASIFISEGGSIKAGTSVLLQGNRLNIDGAIESNAVTLMPHLKDDDYPMILGDTEEAGGFGLNQRALNKIKANDLTIANLPGNQEGLKVYGVVDFTAMPYQPARVTLDAGAGGLSVFGTLKSSTILSLKSTNHVYVDDRTGSVIAKNLAVRGGYVVLGGGNQIETIAGLSNGQPFVVENATAELKVGTVDGLSGIDAGNDGVVDITARGIRGNGTVKGGVVFLTSTDGIGSDSAPLKTQTSGLWVRNRQNGSAPINIRNTGDLILGAALQHPKDSEVPGENTGAINISTSGKLTLMPQSLTPPTLIESEGDLPYGVVETGKGNITLAGTGGVTVLGEVFTTSGNIRLDAGTAKFTTESGAHVETESGDITVAAGSTAIAANTLFASSPSKIHLPSPTTTPPDGGGTGTPPTVDACVANPSQAGCGDVLQKAKEQCVANPNGPNCAAILPKVNECKVNPGALGCAVVLERDKVLQCSINPNAAGCEGAFGICQAKPATPGCDTVIKQHDQISACIANPKANGCRDILPSFESCKATPGIFGCSTVVDEHNRVEACAATPFAENCRSVLPTLNECRTNGSLFGCSAVLAYDACKANPSGPGCDAVLPPLASCKLTPTADGCQQVLAKTFDFCLASPNDARCVGVLPPLSQCVADPTAKGCAVVLPKLSECIGSPTLQGCSVVLPKLEQCAANPNMEGCVAVLPKPDFCSTHPLDPTCRPFTPVGGDNKQMTPVQQALNTTVNIINAASGSRPGAGGGATGAPGNSTGGDSDKSDKSADKKAGPTASENSGAKNEKPATKLYCN